MVWRVFATSKPTPHPRPLYAQLYLIHTCMPSFISFTQSSGGAHPPTPLQPFTPHGRAHPHLVSKVDLLVPSLVDLDAQDALFWLQRLRVALPGRKLLEDRLKPESGGGGGLVSDEGGCCGDGHARVRPIGRAPSRIENNTCEYKRTRKKLLD